MSGGENQQFQSDDSPWEQCIRQDIAIPHQDPIPASSSERNHHLGDARHIHRGPHALLPNTQQPILLPLCHQ